MTPEKFKRKLTAILSQVRITTNGERIAYESK